MLPKPTVKYIKSLLRTMSSQATSENAVVSLERTLLALTEAVQRQAVYIPLELWQPEWYKQAPFILPDRDNMHRWIMMHVVRIEDDIIHVDCACFMNHSIEPFYYQHTLDKEGIKRLELPELELDDFIEVGFYHNYETDLRSAIHPRKVEVSNVIELKLAPERDKEEVPQEKAKRYHDRSKISTKTTPRESH